MPTSVGKFDQRIKLYKYAGTRSATGAPHVAWKFLASAWAQYNPAAKAKAGQEVVIGGEFQGDAMVYFTIKYRDDFGVKDKIVFDGLDWDVQSVAKEGLRNELLTMLCKARRVP